MKKTPKIGGQENLTLMYEDLLVVLSELSTEAPKIKKLYDAVLIKLDEQDSVVQKGTVALQSIADEEYNRVVKERDKLLEQTAEMLKEMEQMSQKLKQTLTEAVPIIRNIQAFEEHQKSLEERLSRIEANQKTYNNQNRLESESSQKFTTKKWIELSADEISRRTGGNLSEKDVLDLMFEMVEEELTEAEISTLLQRMAEEKMKKTEVLNYIRKKSRKSHDEKEKVKQKTSSHIDYDDVDTIKNLYDKYHAYVDGPFLVVRNSWYGDYCLAVETFQRNNTWVRGRTFTNGIAGKQTSHHADTEEFRMYNGPSVDKIKSQL